MAIGVTNNLVGRRFGSLTVVARDGSDARRNARWACVCDCGAELSVLGYALTSKQVSCGKSSCNPALTKSANIHREKAKYSGDDTGMMALIGQYRRHANRREMEFSVSGDEFEEEAKKPCTYCGAEPIPKNIMVGSGAGRRERHTVANGIDRVDSSKGYISGNITSCCFACNTAKNSMTVDEFLGWVKRVYAHNFHD